MAAQKERRKYDEEFIDRLARIEEHMGSIEKHLCTINGNIADYPVTKNKIENACLKLTELDADVSTMDKLIGNIKVKIWSIAGFIGIISGGIGTGLGLLITRLTTGGA